MSELIDIFDGNYRPIGSLDRLVVHQQGLWHHTFHCWIAGRRDSARFVLAQLRSHTKKNYPDCLDITAAGHLQAGEEPLQGIRELEEELGIDVDPGSLEYLGIKHDIADEPNGIRNREFAHVFLLRDDRELSAYRLQEDEVSGLVEIDLEEGLSLFSGKVQSVECRATRVENGQLVESRRTITKQDFIPRIDSYYLKIFIMATLMLDGATYLSI